MSREQFDTQADEVITRALRPENLGFLTKSDVLKLSLSDKHRLTPCLVRCGACRFIAAAQYVGQLIYIINTEGSDYVRDVSLTAQYLSRARDEGRVSL